MKGKFFSLSLLQREKSQFVPLLCKLVVFLCLAHERVADKMM